MPTTLSFTNTATSGAVAAGDDATLQAYTGPLTIKIRLLVDALRAMALGTSGAYATVFCIGDGGAGHQTTQKVEWYVQGVSGSTVRWYGNLPTGGGLNNTALAAATTSQLPADGSYVWLVADIDPANSAGEGRTTFCGIYADVAGSIGAAIGTPVTNSAAVAARTAAGCGTVRIGDGTQGNTLAMTADVVALYSVATTAATRATTPSAGDANLFGYWDFTEGSGTTTTASAGSLSSTGKVLTLVSASWGLPGAAPTIALAGLATFTAYQGGPSPATQTLTITNSGTGTLDGLALGAIDTSASPALAGTITRGALSTTTAPATLTLAVATGALAPGTYTVSFPVTATASGVTNSPLTVTATVVVSTVPVIAVPSAPTSDPWWERAEGTGAPAALTLNVNNTGGGGTLANLTAVVTAPAGEPAGWLAAAVNLVGGLTQWQLVLTPAAIDGAGDTMPSRLSQATVTLRADGALPVVLRPTLRFDPVDAVMTFKFIALGADGVTRAPLRPISYTVDRTDLVTLNGGASCITAGLVTVVAIAPVTVPTAITFTGTAGGFLWRRGAVVYPNGTVSFTGATYPMQFASPFTEDYA